MNKMYFFEGYKQSITKFLGIKLKFKRRDFCFRFLLCKLIGVVNKRYSALGHYLAKYLYAPALAEKELQNIPESEINVMTDKIWSMWLQDDVPEIIQMCLESIKRIYPETVIITDKNLLDYVDLPDYIYKKYKAGIIHPAQFSDYVRVYLLDKYGGTWLDASLLMLDKIPRFIMKQDFFILQTHDKSEISSFFIHSAKNNFLTKTMRIYCEEYWKYENITIDYFYFHRYFELLCKKNEKAGNIYQNIIPYLNAVTKYMSYYIKDNADEDCWDYLSENCFMYKVQRKNKQAIENKNSWYWFLLHKYKNNKQTTQS